SATSSLASRPATRRLSGRFSNELDIVRSDRLRARLLRRRFRPGAGPAGARPARTRSRVRARPALFPRHARHAPARHRAPERRLLRGGAPDRAPRVRELRRDGEVHPARRGDRMSPIPFWAELAVSVLLVMSGTFVVISA